MMKSFEETPPGCVNFLVAGVVTDEMQFRLEQIGVVKTFLLHELQEGGQIWNDFTYELFHHALRISLAPMTQGTAVVIARTAN